MSTTLTLRPSRSRPPAPADRSWQRVRLASVVDALGSGLLVPLELLFLHVVVGLSLATAGLVMGACALAGLALLPVAGPVLDRIGPRRVIVALGVTRCVALGGCVVATRPAVVVVLFCVTAVADRWEHPTQASLVAGLSGSSEQRSARLATLRGLRNGCMTTGALLAALVATGGALGYRLAVGVDALSFAAVVAVLLPLRPTRGPVAGGSSEGVRSADDAATAGYRAVLRDASYVRLTLANTVFALGYTVLVTGLPAYLIGVLDAPAALGAAAFAVNTALVACGQQVTHRCTRLLPAGAVTAVGGLVFAGAFVGFAALAAVAGSPVLLVVGTVLVTALYTVGELLHSAGSTNLSLDLAPVTEHGRHLAFFQLSWAVAPVVGPALFTWLAGVGGAALWLPLALATVGAAALVTRLRADAVRLP